MKHYSEADLLETYYTQPGESMPVMMHLAGCHDCAARYQRLAQKLRVMMDWTLDLVFSKDLVQFLTLRAPTVSHVEHSEHARHL